MLGSAGRLQSRSPKMRSAAFATRVVSL